MGIKKWFKRTGGWFKDKFHAAKTGVQKFAKVVKENVVPAVQKGMNFIDKTPLSGVINAYTGGAFDKARRLINLIPNGNVKDKMNAYVNKGEEFKNNMNSELDKRQNQARDLMHKGVELYDKGREIITT